MNTAKLTKRRTRTLTVTVVTVAVVVACSLGAHAYAWNLICGVSIGFTENCGGSEALLARQYEVDSALLRGIGEYYLAISELQRIDIDAVRRVGADQNASVLVRNGQARLRSSRDSIAAAIEQGNALVRASQSSPCRFSARERTTAQDTLREAAKLADASAALQASIARGVLPRIETVHAGVAAAQKITANGILLSKQHIGKPHHSGAKEEIRITK